MSNTNTNLQTQTSNALHNAIMETGGKDRPPMSAPEGSLETTTEGYMGNYKNVSQDIRDQLNAEAEVVQIILTGIDNDIYSIIDACPNACEMWKANERLKQGESINVQDLKTNLYWEFGKFTSRDGESLVLLKFLLQLQPEWQRFMTVVKQSQELKTVSYHKLYDILKQHQNEVNEIRAKRLAPANKNSGKEIINFPPPTYDQEPTMVAEYDEISKEKEIDKLMALISLSFKKIYKPTNNNLGTSSNTSRGECRRMSETETGKGCRLSQGEMLLCKQEEAKFQLNAEQADWRDGINDELDDRELEAHYMYMAQIQEVNPDVVDNSGPIFDTEPLHK
ncbi:hypothetical protein Tco_0273475, partial [Tanacetum coccineum]